MARDLLDVVKRDYGAFCPAAYGPREVKLPIEGSAAGKHERLQVRQWPVELVNPGLKPVNMRSLCLRHPLPARAEWGGELRAQVKELVLDKDEPIADVRLGSVVRNRNADADMAVQLVHISVRINPRVVLANAGAANQAG